VLCCRFKADVGGQVRAFDAEMGAALWQYEAGQSVGGGIVSYQAAGRQKIGVAVGGKSKVWSGGDDPGRILACELR
jgi:hypothetical protein